MGKWAVVKKRQSVSLWASGAGSQEAELSVWAESSHAHKGRWCSHTGHTAAAQQCRDQNSQSPLSLPGEIFLSSTAASLSFSMALITASCVRELLGISMAQCSHCTWHFLLQWCLWRREQHVPRHGPSQHLWPQICQLQPSSAAKTQTFWWGFELLHTHSVAVSQRTSDQRNGLTQLQREANHHSKNRQQIHHPNRVQTPHLFHPRQSPVHNPATSRCKIRQNRWLNCEINQQRELQ